MIFSFLSAIFFGLTLVANASTTPFHVSGEDLLGGPAIDVSSLDKKGLVVVFLSAKCPCSKSHVDELKALASAHPDFQFVAVHSNENEPFAKAYFEKLGLPFRVIEDHKFTLANQLKALKTPHAFVLAPDGKVLYQGGVSDSRKFERADKKFLRAALDDLSAGRKVAVTEGRTLGCEISRGEHNVW